MQSHTSQNRRYGIYLGINYDSSDILNRTIREWRKHANIKSIYIVDNFSNVCEAERVRQICLDNDANYIKNSNSGYGSALNIGLARIIQDHQNNDYVVLFGNIDVYPVALHLDSVDDKNIPIIKIMQDGRNLNPFLQKNHDHILFVPCLAARLESEVILLIWLILKKIFQLFPSEPAAAHGSLFCLTKDQLVKLVPIFNEHVFLYCEELFLARRIKLKGYAYRHSDISVEHIGSVSTSTTIKLNKRLFFLNWAKSMRIYCNG